MRISDWSSDVCSSDLDYLGMAGMADEEDVPSILNQPFGLAMNLGDERAGGVEIIEAALFGRGRNRLRHAMGREDHRHAVRNLVEFGDEDRALGLDRKSTRLNSSH